MTSSEHPAQAGNEPPWTNESVRAFANGDDPLAKIVTLVRKVMAAAADAGLQGPPFDPLSLAELLGLSLRARDDVADARVSSETVGVRGSPDAPLSAFVTAAVPLVLEYNPTRPKGRVRYNVAHEIAHTLFADVANATRNRTGAGAVPQYGGTDSWQLELLCNVAAAELLMPTEAVAGIVDIDTDIDFIMAQRRRFDVSTEAMLRRLASATSKPLAVVATSRVVDRGNAALRVEYVVNSRIFALPTARGHVMPADTVLGTCTAVGQTVRGDLTVTGQRLNVQAVGAPAYPGRAMPRVLAICEPTDAPKVSNPLLKFVTGDVTRPEAKAPVIIGHVTNDASRSWGRQGVAQALSARFPKAASSYHYWTIASPDNLRLGNVHMIEASADPPVHIASLVVQHGYGPGSPLRLAYTALAEALDKVSTAAAARAAEVHLPRIGTGQAGARWDLVEAEIDEALIRRNVPVVIYTLPSPLAGERI